MNDSKNISRVDLTDIFNAVKRRCGRSLRVLDLEIDDYLISENEHDELFDFVMAGAAGIANNAHMIKYRDQGPLDALTYFVDLEKPTDADHYDVGDSDVDGDETITSPESTLTLTVIPSDSDEVIIAGKTYTFQTVLTDVDGNVLIGADIEESLDNLAAAINLGTGAGTLYATSTTALIEDEEEAVVNTDTLVFGKTILVDDINTHKVFQPDEKLTNGTMDTIDLNFEDPNDPAATYMTRNRYTISQNFIKEALICYILYRWWEMVGLDSLAAKDKRRYEDNKVRFNSNRNHEERGACLNPRPLYW